ncbi:FecR domain-containing protein [Chitinophaga sp.]|uniref:FecR family protein n=1 Tax=Chitinophaga sp. TaxID=1869181 RepID=UPI002635A3E8|nr:FecR domain-containing protein [uncultured Chitinophaga sp.]
MSQHPHITITDELLVKFLAGEAGPDEAMAIGDWLETPANAAAFRQLQKAWDAAGPGDPYQPPDVAAAWGHWQKVQEAPVKIRRIWPQWVAAAVVVLLAGSLWFFSGDVGEKDREVSISIENNKDVGVSSPLPDGSVVHIAPGGKAAYVSNPFTGRQTTIMGNATFEVAADPALPFTVQAGPLIIRVLGTVFDVRQYPDSITVDVRQGVVRAVGKTDSVLLRSGMRTVYLLQAERFAGRSPDSPGVLPSKTVFEFNDTPLGEAIEKLSAAYGIPVALDNPALANCRINTSFTDKPLDYVLTVITESLRLEYRKANDTVYIYGNACD